jgi:uncharacterized membrane protein
MEPSPRHRPSDATPDPVRSLWVCALLGAGIMAAADEVVFHQLLRWHHFYDRGTSDAALVSDGVLHAVELIAVVAGAVLLADLRGRGVLDRRHGAAGLLLGAGGFQLFDGIVDHKLLRVHQVRYDVELRPYDLAWNGAALALIAAGAWVLVRARRATADPRA